jgi:diguanylate cyclase (GGDEF)-like protein
MPTPIPSSAPSSTSHFPQPYGRWASVPVVLLLKNPTTRNSIQALLQQFGFMVVVADHASKFPLAPLAFLCSLDEAEEVRKYYPKVDIIAVVDNPGLDERLAAVRTGCRATVASDVDAPELASAMERLFPLELEIPRVLIVDDDAYVSQRTAIVLEQAGLEVHILTDPRKLLEQVAETRPHLVIMDMRLPGCTGLELAAVLRQDDRMVGVPIVFLTAEDRPARALEALEIGADDFLVKPVESSRLVSVVLSRLERSRVLRSFMDHDSLTRLLSHARTLERLEAEVMGAQRRGDVLSIAILDLDHFKLVNDKYGHATGDRVLRSLSTVLRRRARRTDVIGRCGGEEFAIIMSGASGSDACRLINERREMFALLHFTTPNGPMSCTFSAGVAELKHGDTPATLWDRADVALYDAKHAGRNRVELATYILKEEEL